jgi:hypothetical protein
MQGARLDLLAGVWCVCVAGGCSLLTTFDGFSEGPHPTDSGAADVHTDGPACKNDLSNIGTGDFTIAMSLTTSQTGVVAIANQRAICNGSVFWDVHMTNGTVQAETDDGTHHAEVDATGVLVNDGKPHSILVQRRTEVLSLSVDGKSLSETSSMSAFGQLPPLVSGNSPCVGHTGYFALVGMPTGLCVTSP